MNEIKENKTSEMRGGATVVWECRNFKRKGNWASVGKRRPRWVFKSGRFK